MQLPDDDGHEVDRAMYLIVLMLAIFFGALAGLIAGALLSNL